MAEGDEDVTVRSPRSDDGQVENPGASTASTPDEVKVDSSKQTLPVLKGTFPTADAVEEWSMGFEAGLSILALGEVLEIDWKVEDIRKLSTRTDVDKAKLLKNDKVFNHLITCTRDGPRAIVKDNRKTMNAYKTYRMILETYLDTDSNKADEHRIAFNDVPKIDPFGDPIETLRKLKKHADRVEECDATQAISEKEIMMRLISLRPTCKIEQVGSIEFEIAKHYETFKKTIEDKGYDTWTITTFQKELKKQFDDNIKKFVEGKEKVKAKGQESFFVKNGGKKFKAKFTGTCHYCKIPGHKIEDCRKKK
jgi:hypothetical protein